jgi:NitT/TauT family transport system permease protein
LTALALATLFGVVVALIFVQSRWIEMSFFPYAILLQVTPIVAIAPLIIIWVRDTRAALVLCAVVVAIFPVISNTTLGLRSVDPGLLNLFRLARATRWQTLWRLRVPSALPYFFGGLRIASGLALIGAVVAEFVAGTGGQGAGLAYQILLAGIQLNIPRLFAALALIALAGVSMFAATVGLSRLALARWHESELHPGE